MDSRYMKHLAYILLFLCTTNTLEHRLL